jgi:hypothetical protein
MICLHGIDVLDPISLNGLKLSVVAVRSLICRYVIVSLVNL